MLIRVLVIDADDLLRWSLRQYLPRSCGLRVVDDTADGLEGLALGHLLRPDVVLIDLDLPKPQDVELLSHYARDLPNCRVVAHSHCADPLWVSKILEAGAQGYVVRNGKLEELGLAITATGRGEVYVSPEIRL